MQCEMPMTAAASATDIQYIAGTLAYPHWSIIQSATGFAQR
jgi:hypothetical protein